MPNDSNDKTAMDSTWRPPILEGEPPVQPGKPTGIKVLIVGAGFGGLACAIQSRIEGHEVHIFEQFDQMIKLGDSIGIFPNAGRFFPRWGIHDEMMSYCGVSKGWRIIRFDGVVLGDSRPPPGFQFPKDAPLYDCHRADMHRLLFETAARMGAELHLGSRVEKYNEDDDGAEIIMNGKTWRGDVVIGADGVKSRARVSVIGYEDKTLASGYALYRAYFDASIIKNDPLTSHLVLDNDDARTGWIGPDVHAICATIKRGKEFNWVLTHRDESSIDESWVFPGKIDEALKCIDGWDPIIRRVVELTPKECLLDWKLMFRDPLPTWVSPKGRIALLGDAAHPFLPTSQQGGSQALEDGVTIAICLSKIHGNKKEVPLAMRVYERIRYDRVARIQQLGVRNRENWHKADYSNPEEITAEKMKLPMPKWMLGHDAEKAAHDKWEGIRRDIEEGKPWTPRDWGKGIDLNIDDDDENDSEAAKLATKDIPVPTETLDALGSQ